MLTEEQKKLITDSVMALHGVFRYDWLYSTIKQYEYIKAFIDACDSVGIDEKSAKAFVVDLEKYTIEEKGASEEQYKLLQKFLNK